MKKHLVNSSFSNHSLSIKKKISKSRRCREGPTALEQLVDQKFIDKENFCNDFSIETFHTKMETEEEQMGCFKSIENHP